MTGAVVSTTRTLEPQELALPEPSVAEHSTCVSPSGNVDPERGQAALSVPQQMSLDVAANETAAPAGLVHSRRMGAGQVISGRVVSTTRTLEAQELALPEPSATEHSTGVRPSANAEPESGQAGARVPQQVSVEEAAK